MNLKSEDIENPVLELNAENRLKSAKNTERQKDRICKSLVIEELMNEISREIKRKRIKIKRIKLEKIWPKSK